MLKKDLENPRMAEALVEKAAVVRRSFSTGWIALIALAVEFP